jgi:catechol 2,3-dioxygenase-like lactoylglutathione lyase family enzyme
MAAGLKFDHVLIVVEDLEAVTAFFLKLGLEEEGSGTVEGEWADTAIGLSDVRADIVLLRLPGGGTKLELSKFHKPVHEQGPQAAPANQLGLRNVAFEVDDLHATVAWLKEDGFQLVGGIANYADIYLLCYVRGPEEIIVMLAERIG